MNNGSTMQPLTVSAMLEVPLRSLRRRASRQMARHRQQLRRQFSDNYELHFRTYRDALWIWVSGWWPGESTWMWPALFMLSSYIKSADAGVDDGDDEVQRIGTLQHIRTVLRGLHGLGIDRSVVGTDSDAMLIWLMRKSRQRGINILDDLSAAFEAFAADGRRIIEKRPVPTEEEFEQIVRGDYLLGVVYGLIFGLDRATAVRTSRINMPFIFWTDTLTDLANDVSRGHINFPESRCVGFTSAQLLACDNWEELGRVPGFISWYTEQATKWLDYWRMVGEPEMQRSLALVPMAWRSEFAKKNFRYNCNRVVVELELCQKRYAQSLLCLSLIAPPVVTGGAIN
jgi:hypothetical protein